MWCTGWILLGICSLGQIEASEKQHESLKVLIGQLASSDSAARQQAAQSICNDVLRWDPVYDAFWPRSEHRDRVRTEARPLLPSAMELLEHSDADVRRTAIRLIAHVGAEARGAIPALWSIIRRGDSSSDDRYDAAVALLHIIPPSQPIVGDLFAAWEDERLAIVPKEADLPRELLATNIGLSIPLLAGPLIHSGHTKSEVASLLQVARHGNSTASRVLAVALLGEFGADARPAIPHLRTLLKDNDPLVRRTAWGAILQIDGEGRTTTHIEPHELWSNDERDELEQVAREYREQQKRERRENMAFLIEYPEGLEIAVATLRYCSGAHQRRTLRLLAEVGPPARSANAEIQKLLCDADPETRWLATASAYRTY